MRAGEQESLCLRQIVALTRRGRGRIEALRAAGAGLPSGPLRARVEAALRALESGEPGEDVLARDAGPDALTTRCPSRCPRT